MKIIKNLSLLLISFILSYLVSGLFFGKIYEVLYGGSSGLFIIYEGIAKLFFVFVLVFIFSMVLLFTAFGDRKKYWWIGILLIPAALFEIYFDFQHIYIPILLGLIGWGIGFGIRKLVSPKKLV
jgi:hypothetical protein